jgi:hypothetical protein
MQFLKINRQYYYIVKVISWVHLIMDLLMSNELEKTWKEAVMIWLEISRNLHEKVEENY